MARRKPVRLRLKLAVRIFGLDAAGKLFNVLVNTLDVSRQGARICGFGRLLAQGDVIGLHYGGAKARDEVPGEKRAS